MTKYASQLKDFRDLLAATASAKNLPDAIIEKDYFVVRALFALCEAAPGQFVFKGGTSLAKGWDLLERFSEDIDLLFRTADGHGGEISRGEVDRRLERAEQIVGSTEGFQFLRQTRSRGVRRCSDFQYPRTSTAAISIGQTVRLEMGTRGGTQPSSTRTIRSYICEVAEKQGQANLAEDLRPFSVECLDVTRTTVEKLFAVHAAFERDRARGRTRHYYDLFQSTGLEEVRAFLGAEEYNRVRDDVELYSRANWPEAALPPNGKFSESTAFAPSRDDLMVLKQHYREERDLFL
ncbi:MAG TPA: nucleotidyl transferase AbiEii/AbiGii toxin family protein [Candidatus Acidoferrales bacterium]|jgi:predicted nucleotidyltransferase component of viral defense system|nr:nucleotidyl transferase AbiEii/AbiGii toxin family protein [Candidatus Acidoferrales bacterium]